jgi:hypothetical protein
MVEVRIRIAVISTVIAALLLAAVVPLGIDTERAVGDAVRGRKQDYQIVAESLQRLGFAAGDRLALVGDNFSPYYARLARMQVVAQIYEADKFWQLTPAELRQLARQLASIQVKAILAKNPPPGSVRPNWLDIDASQWNRYSLLLLPIVEPVEKSLRTDVSR